MSDKEIRAKSEKLTAIKGMNDVLPPDSAAVEWLESKVRALMAGYAYRNIRTPIVERTPLFVRGLGEVTDIVEKEMYSFEDSLNGDLLTLRPEATAGVVRAVVEHSMLYDGGKRLYYMGPMFRHERPQRGRYRQFDQIGAEALGFSGPEVDAELILLAVALWKDLGLTDVQLELNSLGQPQERLAHRQALISHFERYADVLDEDAKRRLYSNPLRILDTKNPAMLSVVESAPRPLDYLGQASLAHFNTLKTILDANGVAYIVNPRLVRGMDYYNLTVFEFTTDRLGSQGTVCAGGRYDYLIEQLGGKPAPAVGWALGVDRVLELIREQGLPSVVPPLDAYAIVLDVDALPLVLQTLQTLRAAGVSVQMHTSSGDAMGSMKSQFKRADGSGARFALIFGADEMAKNLVTVKSLRDGNGAQVSQSLSDVLGWSSTLQLQN
ncbi:MAG: histidine--tRNA ligase [Gammaproteobacteria bacterium]|uniref:histidine--tRNA ligase n=1 Tax=Rhodoferax sp. TaxID=50421 RepID=UPI0017DFB388|nr:histidine--tRNA ligase [Rhodoferax sp.]MBU3899578.1 histidine--tRNA ligase [Gammaproteobacteria bacterium]MBA3059885.1 histidine--tRNA ligase [Rhodoferax sp.]MBU3998909.1 histidine--tRNA ligase [Gammaproteobacteria bacterium]MBU4018054.1 histidine--tRNA ligase [Gammaproteobacteria bacterium]MBU4080255.1 histidine--tRNA ligase [Gammaproteobacteria bacterium]